jgi:hypothetical protein
MTNFSNSLAVRDEGNRSRVVEAITGSNSAAHPVRIIVGRVTPIVGRAPVVAALRTAVDTMIGGSPAVGLLCGEPGIGKSTLAREAVDYAATRGAVTAWSTCWDADGAPPFWPWQQVLRSLGFQPADLAAGTAANPADRRFRLFAAVLAALSERAEREPVVVVLDDLQWADTGSLRLLVFLARQLRHARTALIGTYRTVDPRPSAGLLEAIADLAGVAVTHEVHGLAEAEVGELLAVTVGAMPADVVGRVHRRTGGNPFFVREVAGTAREGSVPPSVQAALGRQLDRLPGATLELLATCAIFGNRAPLSLLELVVADARAGVDVTPGALVRALATAADEGLLVLEPAHVRFPHDLVREVAATRAHPWQRPGIHAAMATALRTGGASAAEIARHALAAGPAIPTQDAVDACAAAAREATAALAYETATRWWRQATGVAAPPNAALRLDLADAAARSGDHDEARAIYLAVGRVTRGGDLARAALGLHALGTANESSHREVIDLLEHALADQGTPTTADHPRVLAALARELADGIDRDRDRAAALVDEAVRAARAADDPATLAFCLFAAHDVGWTPGSAARRLALAEQMATAAGADPELAFEAMFCRFVAQVDLGDPGFEITLRDLARHADDHRLPRQQFLVASREAMVADLRGDRGQATRLRERADDLAAMIGHPDRLGVRATQLMAVALADHGPAGVADLEARIGTIAPTEFEPEMRSFRALADGRPEQAAAILRGAAPPAERARYRWRALAALAMSAEVALAAGAEDLCAVLYEGLLPYADEVIDIGGAVVVLGPASMYLGLLAPAAGRPDAADAHLRTGIEIAARIGAVGCVRRCERALAVRRAGTFRRAGPTWLLGFAGRTAVLPDAKGLHDLATLLGAPGRDVPATRLLTEGRVTGADGGADEVLDRTARAAYRARLDALDLALDEAGAAGRPAPQLAAERSALITELARATGLDGRSRRLGDPVERARTTVTARIRDTLRRLDEHHPELAEHLRASVTTGRVCVYRPDPPVRWEL